jgi:MYXO-CTERM domain-containing protein
MRLASPRFSTLVAALFTAALGFVAAPAFAGGNPGECAGGSCGTPNNNGGGCCCCCGGSVLVDYTDVGVTYEQSDDSDHDGIDDDLDNCPFTPNADQLDSDGDGVGDVCDNCVNVGNNNQDVNACGDLWTTANHVQDGVSENIGQVRGAACDPTCSTLSPTEGPPKTVALSPKVQDDPTGNSSNIPSSGEMSCSATAGPASGSFMGWALGAVGLVSLGGIVRRRRNRKAS